MSVLRTAVRELFGLFVDDVGYTIALLTCMAGVAWVARPMAAEGAWWPAALLFVTLAAVLVENVRRSAQRLRKQKAARPAPPG